MADQIANPLQLAVRDFVLSAGACDEHLPIYLDMLEW
jgi:hypothetical protein